MSILNLQAVTFMSTIFKNKSDSQVDFKAAGSDFHVESREGDFHVNIHKQHTTSDFHVKQPSVMTTMSKTTAPKKCL